MTQKIFISYRRIDAEAWAGRIFDRLSAHFGADAIFMDVNTIQAGVDFVEVLENAVQECDVVVSLIGRQWLNVKSPDGQRRLDNPEDFVRIEIAAALDRDIRVIPTLVGGSSMPPSSNLPDNLKSLARRNALTIQHTSFHGDTSRLVQQLELALQDAERSKVERAQRREGAQVQAERQTEVERLMQGVDMAISLADWPLAEEKLKYILNLDAHHAGAGTKLEIVARKMAEAKQTAHDEAEGIAFEKTEAEGIATEKDKPESRPSQPSQPEPEADTIDALSEEITPRTPRPKKTRRKFNWRWLAVLKRVPHWGWGVMAVLLFIIVYSAVVGDLSTVFDTPLSEKGEDGYAITAEKDGMTQLYVSAGEFEMGSEDGNDDSKPTHTVYLDAFWIDKTEVTNSMYAVCVNDDKCAVPSITIFYENDSYAAHPVVYVSWNDADVYCRWAERRLPTEAEWEKTARGADGRTYPWGENINASRANYDRNATDTTPVGSYPDGASLYGALDMAGNVWEWAADWYNRDYYQSSPFENPAGPEFGNYRVLRGGAWNDDADDIESAIRLKYYSFQTDSSVGFRCAASP